MQHLIELALQSPVLVALIGLLGLLVGRQVLQWQLAAVKDSHAAEIRAKDAEIAVLERLTSAKIMEQVTAMKMFWEHRADQQQNEITSLKANLVDERELGGRERERLQAELVQKQADLEFNAQRRRDLGWIIGQLVVQVHQFEQERKRFQDALMSTADQPDDDRPYVKQL